jgi:chemotaxis regulatin CheY-phosphate phosphatase CheZ
LLNARYSRALQDKVAVYDQLVTSVRQLADRNSVFMKNEVELCRLANLSSITKLELEQKEKAIQETNTGTNDDLMSDPLQRKILEMNRSI